MPATKSLFLMGSADLGYGNGIGDKPLPFYKNFYGGGIGSVRGYKPGTVGPQATNPNGTNSYTGGNKKAIGNLELQGTLAGIENMRWNVFYDVGYIGASGLSAPGTYPGMTNPPATGVLQSVGFGLSWVSPMGPLRFSLGWPVATPTNASINKQPFQFTMGSAF